MKSMDIGQDLWLRVYGPRLLVGPQTRKKKKKDQVQYPAILHKQAWSVSSSCPLAELAL